MVNVVKTRPLSPHLGIYRPQISSVLSIMHRMSGVSNFVGLLCVSWWLVLAILSPDNPVSANILSFFSGRLGMMILFAWSFGLFFHFCAGVRHLAWDLGIGFELKTMHKSGYFAVFMAVVLTVVTWIIVLVL